MPRPDDVGDAPAADVRVVSLRRRAAALIVALVAASSALGAAAVSAPASAGHGSRLSALESGVLRELNRIRTEHGLVPVQLNASLAAAAAQHSREMGADGYFEHSSRDGTAFWRRISHFYGSGGYGYWSVGENLLWSSPDVDPSHALELWMNSPEHRANILAPRWRQIGVSAVHLQWAPGAYHGLPVTIITTDFGVRR
jgi:uncharacterized protein YkwD